MAGFRAAGTASGRVWLAPLLALVSIIAPAAASAQEGGASSAAEGVSGKWRPDAAEDALIRAQIEALTTEYYYRIDHGNAESVAELFTPDGVFKPGGSGPYVGREAIRAYYAARSKTIVTRHVSTNLRLTYIDPDHVDGLRVITYFRGDPAEGPPPYHTTPGLMEYHESFVRGHDGQWRFASRRVELLFMRH